MNMKQKLLLAAIAATCAAPAAFAADSTTAAGDVVTTVNQVALISVAGSPTLTCSAPTVAGDSFAACTQGGSPATYKLTSNSQIGDTTGQTITAVITTGGNADPTWGLKVAVAAPTGVTSTVTGPQALSTTGAIVVDHILNVATNTTNPAITYSLNPTAGTVPAYGSSVSRTVTFTISGNNT